MFHLERLPRRIVIIGGGYIAVEFASIFAGLGAETILMHRGEKVLRGFDEDLRDDLMAALEHRGVRLMMLDHLTHVQKSGGTLFATTNEGKSFEADKIMVATGRRPSTGGLGLETVGVKMRPSRRDHRRRLLGDHGARHLCRGRRDQPHRT